jgi:hypothetical protein
MEDSGPEAENEDRARPEGGRIPPAPGGGSGAVRGCAPEKTRRLLSAIDSYLATLPGPGAAEARARLAAAAPASGPPAADPTVARHLAAALALLSPDRPGLAAAIADAAPHLPWVRYDFYPRAAIGAAFADNHAFVSLAAAPGFDLGLFLIAPRTLYRDHRHAAAELYTPLTGPHGWRFAPGDPLHWLPAHTPVWNDPHRPHATLTGAVPFLCLYAWTGDVDALAEVIPAPDWPVLEAANAGP